MERVLFVAMSLMWHVSAFGMIDDKVAGKVKETKEFIFTEDEVAQSDMKDVIKLTVLVKGDDQSVVIRTEYALREGKEGHLSGFQEDKDVVFYVRASDGDEYVFGDDEDLYTFAMSAPYGATGYLYVRGDYDKIEEKLLALFQKKADAKSLSKFTDLVQVLTHQVQRIASKKEFEEFEVFERACDRFVQEIAALNISEDPLENPCKELTFEDVEVPEDEEEDNGSDSE